MVLMDIESIRKFCLSLPHATEDIQWKKDLLFRIGGKIFAGVGLDNSSGGLSFKCSAEKFAELTELEGIEPAPYTARYHWVMLTRFDALSAAEMKALIKESYRMVYEKLPKKVTTQLERS
jgi:predicted DNA-binding protein (MmcQ/YjbR family)